MVVGTSVQMGVDVGVSAATGAQAYNTKLTNKNTTNPRVIIPIFFRQSMPLNDRIQRRRKRLLEAPVSQRLLVP